MRNSITLLLFFSIIAFSSCKKDKADEANTKPQIADIEFALYDLKIPTDTTSTSINFSNTLILKGDYTWTLNLNGAKSNGTYTWTPTESYRAKVKFSIIQWTALNSNIVLSNKIKTVLETVTDCGFPGPNIQVLNFYDILFTTTLRTDKK